MKINKKTFKKSILNKYWHLQNLGMTITTSVPPPSRHHKHPDNGTSTHPTPHPQLLLRFCSHNCNTGATASVSKKCSIFLSVPQDKHIIFSIHILFYPYMPSMKKVIKHVILFPFSTLSFSKAIIVGRKMVASCMHHGAEY